MTDQDIQNTYGEPQYCTRKGCGKLLEKARTSQRGKGVCLACQKIKAREYYYEKRRNI